MHFYNGSVLGTIMVPGGAGPGTVVATGVVPHPSGALEAITYPIVSGGSSYEYEPDTHRLDTASSWDAGGPLQDLDLGYDLAGNLTTVADALGELTQAFTYDPLHRLATATGSGGPLSYGDLAYSYDAAGNILTKGPVGAPLTLLYGGGNAGPHGVTAVSSSETGSFSYDADGQVSYRTRSGQQDLSLGWDDDGRLTHVNVVLDYVYDESGQRSRKKNLSGTADTLYVDPEYEVDLVNAKHQVHYFHGSRRVATENRSGLGLPGNPGSHLSWQVYFPDFVGSNAVVARDDGAVEKSYFRPFGEFAQQGGGMTPYLFTDQEHDPETNLQYFGARYYDPWIGRFLSHDPALVGSFEGATFG
ncbi:MAG: RHS repeat-associated core domain-containing protein, partial [Actinomycetota bacterium]